MQSYLVKSIQKIFSAFDKIDNIPKKLIKYGMFVFLAIFALGTLLVVVYHTSNNPNSYFEFLANSIVKSSFIILAEAVIGGLVMDFAFKKN